jgi:hypothetical protein
MNGKVASTYTKTVRPVLYGTNPVHLVATFQEGFLVSLEQGTASSLTESLLQNQLQNPVFLQNQLH